MVQQSMVQTLGDSLRDVARVLDEVPAVDAALTYPLVPTPIAISVRTGEAVRTLARDFGRTSHTLDLDGDTYTWFEVPAGRFTLRVFAIDKGEMTPPEPIRWDIAPAFFTDEKATREVRRPVDVTERIEAGL